ncbi:MAG: 6-phospho-beta-glucosidase [Spirochaetaceae bacterium]|jgi:6-phospho-beta-glucosidase|nr:6-phospho-beta-glucosidase [Spirochaetaceae bacterium]
MEHDGKGIKVTVIGGGSSYTPELVDGILRRKDTLPVRELWLLDIPEGEKKLSVIAAFAGRMAKKAGSGIRIYPSLDRRAALEGADFVLSQFRVGGLAGRARDEAIPLKYGIIGQETTGPGGYAYALRTLPVIFDICRDIEELSPRAWLINFTNPAGIITEGILNYTGVRAIGLCNGPITTKRAIAALLEVEPQRINAEFVGLNHMSFVRDVTLDGKSIINDLIDLYEKAEGEAREKLKLVSDVLWDPWFIRSLGMLTNFYHRYYFKCRAMLKEQEENYRQNGSRALVVQEIERKLFELYADKSVDEKPAELEQRGGAYYSEAAVALIDAIYNDRNEIHTVNVLNRGTISDLPYNAVIETNALIGAAGASPLVIGKMPEKVAGLIGYVKTYEQLAVKAAVNRSYDDALAAMISNPFVNDYETAKTMMDEFIAAHKPLLDYLAKSPGRIPRRIET